MLLKLLRPLGAIFREGMVLNRRRHADDNILPE